MAIAGERQRRQQLKFELQLLQGNDPRCPICGKPATDLHEIFNRAQTIKNPEARMLTYCPELCVLLCRDCNMKADNNDTRLFLLRHNCELYGRENVLTALNFLWEVSENTLLDKLIEGLKNND